MNELYEDVVYFLLTLCFSLGGQVLLKKGVAQVLAGNPVGIGVFLRDKLPHILVTPFFILGVFCCGLGFLSWIYILSKQDLGRALPALTGIGYLMLFVVGRVVLKEQTTLWNFAGVVCIVGGLYLISLKGP